jgi:YidC/Oxa1 family membrane protein insertase
LNGDFQNPQQDPGSEKRLLLAFALTFLVLLVSQPLIMKYAKQPEPAPAEKPAATQPAAGSVQPAAASTQPVAQPPVVGKVPQAAAPVPAVQAASEQETVVENDFYRIVFTNRGAQVKSWVLKKYNDHPGGKPLDLVHAAAAEKYGYPFSLWTYDEGLRKKLGAALYVVSAEGGSPAAGATLKAPASLTFAYADGETVVRKQLRFDHSYVVEVETSVLEKGSGVQAYLAWPAAFGDQSQAVQYAAAQVEWYSGGRNWHGGEKVERLAFKKVSGGATVGGPLYWAGVADPSFAAVFLPDDPGSAALVTLHNEIDIPKDASNPQSKEMQKVPVLGAAAGDTRGFTRGRWFVGPKAVDVLDAIHVRGESATDLRNLVDFGMFGVLARPLFLWLKWTHEHWVANWGWDIVILTVIINLVLMPLRISGMKSAMKMQKLAPQIKAIQEKYKKYSFNDPRRAEMNTEMTALYKKEGANPVGGCFPMLLQFPFLVAFYAMLTAAIELRHAPWLWIHDLSAADPYHILPILLIVTMFLVQKVTPTAGMDPMQQKMMNIMMPVFLGFISWSLAAGLGVYWVASNVIALAQQMVLYRTKFGREMKAQMEKHARKKAGK